MITENADPAVRHDLETLARRWVPDADPAYRPERVPLAVWGGPAHD
jgi:hypothetical protein